MPTLVIAHSIVKNMSVETPTAIVKCLPGTKTGDIQSYLNCWPKIGVITFKLLFMH